jgi:hypothetical protein
VTEQSYDTLHFALYLTNTPRGLQATTGRMERNGGGQRIFYIHIVQRRTAGYKAGELQIQTETT